MKKFFLLVVLLMIVANWFRGWVSSGGMDQFIGQHKNDRATPQILYWISQCCYVAQQPKSASHYFRWLVNDYPTDPKISKVRWQLAKCYEETQQRALALEQYTILKDSFTNTEHGRLAVKRYEQIRY